MELAYKTNFLNPKFHSQPTQFLISCPKLFICIGKQTFLFLFQIKSLGLKMKNLEDVIFKKIVGLEVLMVAQ